jgi:hypothetical protein
LTLQMFELEKEKGHENKTQWTKLTM